MKQDTLSAYECRIKMHNHKTSCYFLIDDPKIQVKEGALKLLHIALIN